MSPKSLQPTHIGHVPDPFGGDGYLVAVQPMTRALPALVRVESADSAYYVDADAARELAAQLLRAADVADPQPTPSSVIATYDGHIVRGVN